jgi:hypothetical protein
MVYQSERGLVLMPDGRGRAVGIGADGGTTVEFPAISGALSETFAMRSWTPTELGSLAPFELSLRAPDEPARTFSKRSIVMIGSWTPRLMVYSIMEQAPPLRSAAQTIGSPLKIDVVKTKFELLL